MILDILKIQNPADIPILRAQSIDVEFSQEIHDLCLSMVETMFAANGVGLAAPQIGKNLNIFVMRTKESLEDDTSRDHRILINPGTISTGNFRYLDREGCLSIPGFMGDVRRFKEIEFTYSTSEGTLQQTNLSGLEARIYQHEFDHLRGTLFIDRAEELFVVKKKK